MNATIIFQIMAIVISLGMIPTFTIFSFSQSNSTLPDDLPSTTLLSNSSILDEPSDDNSIENETSFASLSRSLAETNQSDDELTSLPPFTESELGDEQTESESEDEINEEEDIQ
jgi:hypothetical protein